MSYKDSQLLTKARAKYILLIWWVDDLRNQKYPKKDGQNTQILDGYWRYRDIEKAVVEYIDHIMKN